MARPHWGSLGLIGAHWGSLGLVGARWGSLGLTWEGGRGVVGFRASLPVGDLFEELVIETQRCDVVRRRQLQIGLSVAHHERLQHAEQRVARQLLLLN